MDPSKARLRLELRGGRFSESPDRAQARAQRLAELAPELRPTAGRAVAAFLPTNAEPDITALVTALDLPVVVPRVIGAELEWVTADPASLAGPRRGIPVPAGEAVARGAGVVDLGVGLMLVPALAVDPVTGTRLGYGRGYYDRLLRSMPSAARQRLNVVAVCRAVELIDLPRQGHDQPMDGVVTEDGYRRIPQG